MPSAGAVLVEGAVEQQGLRHRRRVFSKLEAKSIDEEPNRSVVVLNDEGELLQVHGVSQSQQTVDERTDGRSANPVEAVAEGGNTGGRDCACRSVGSIRAACSVW